MLQMIVTAWQSIGDSRRRLLQRKNEKSECLRQVIMGRQGKRICYVCSKSPPEKINVFAVSVLKEKNIHLQSLCTT